mgnify:CR=1 FL=1
MQASNLIQTRASSPSNKRTKCLQIGANQSNSRHRIQATPSQTAQAPSAGATLSQSSSPCAWSLKVTTSSTRQRVPYAQISWWTPREKVEAHISASSRSQPISTRCPWLSFQGLLRMRASWKNISRRKTQMLQRRWRHTSDIRARSRLVMWAASKSVMWAASGEDIPRSCPRWCLQNSIAVRSQARSPKRTPLWFTCFMATPSQNQRRRAAARSQPRANHRSL